MAKVLLARHVPEAVVTLAQAQFDVTVRAKTTT